MQDRWMQILEGLARLIAGAVGTLVASLSALLRTLARARVALVATAMLGLLAYSVWRHPPIETVAPGEVGIRSNRLDGTTIEVREGPTLVIPWLHQLRRYSLRDRSFRPPESSQASGAAPFQSAEGLSIGVDLSVRYALDPARLADIAAQLPDDIDGEVVQPAVQGVAYNLFPRYTVREILSTKRAEIQEALATELKPRLARDGIVLRGVTLGRIDLPAEYRVGMEQLLAEELQSEKMKYTLALKEQQVKESELEAEAAKVRREKDAQAAASEQVIAARAQEEAMRHVLPFKQKQIEQRKLEAEADKLARISRAQAESEARRIEAAGEAESRQKLADAETYRLEHLGKVTSAQMERDGELLTRHPLLIQKTMADKLSDKISVIIAAPPASGGFVGANLLGQAATGGQ